MNAGKVFAMLAILTKRPMSLQEIAKTAGISERQAWRYMKEIEALGFAVDKENRHDGKFFMVPGVYPDFVKSILKNEQSQSVA